MRLILFIALMCAGLGRAQEGPPIRISECKAPACVLVVGPDLHALIEAHNTNVDRIKALERELEDLKKIKGCAKLEVTEPPRNFVPKKERDS